MSILQGIGRRYRTEGSSLLLGTYGHLALCACLIGLVMLAPDIRMGGAVLTCMVVAVAVYPGAVRRLMRLRWLVWLLLLTVPTLFFYGQRDATIAGIPFSSEGGIVAAQIAARFVVVMIVVQGFTASVDIVALAGLLERFGLRGLGFSLGVAINLLPALQDSSRNAWFALRMRGGARRQWWRASQLLLMTIVTNALRRAEEISLAAEVRAFSPELARPLPVKHGMLDGLIAIGGLLVLGVFTLL